MAIYRNEELVVSNHIAMPDNRDFTGRILGTYVIEKVKKRGSSGFNEVQTIGGTYYLHDICDFRDFENVCG